jgi:hypothetical protein
VVFLASLLFAHLLEMMLTFVSGVCCGVVFVHLSFYSFFLRLKFFLMHLRYIPNSFMKTYQWIHKHSEWLKLQCPTWVIWWPSQNVSSVNHLVKMLEDDHVKYRNGYCINTK